MPRRSRFQIEPLKDMVAVGLTDAHSALIWARSEQPGRLRVQWWREDRPNKPLEAQADIPEGNDRDNTCVTRIPGDSDSSRLEPLRRYGFRVLRASDGHVVGQGGFETAPETPLDTPNRFSVALMSCHQPFDSKGRIRESSELMLRAALRVMRKRDTRFALLMGDQMYSDFPENLSLHDSKYLQRVAPQGKTLLKGLSPDEVRCVYQERYRLFWDHAEWQALLASIPSYPILDDHEIVDNWGSRPVYQTREWRNIGLGARLAYHDYQGSRVLPPSGQGLPTSFHYSLNWGNTAVFVMDLRSQRTAGEGGQLYGSDQQADLETFLHRHRETPVILLVLSVPIVHLPRLLAKIVSRLPHTGEDFSDRWSSGAHVRDRDRLLRILHAHQRRHPTQKLVLLSGDIHIGCVHVLRWGDGGPALYQMISSPITHQTGILLQWASKAIIGLNHGIATQDGELQASVRPLKGEASGMKNPYGKLNLGLIEVETPEPGAMPRLRFLLYGHKRGEPFCAYRSPPI